LITALPDAEFGETALSGGALITGLPDAEFGETALSGGALITALPDAELGKTALVSGALITALPDAEFWETALVGGAFMVGTALSGVACISSLQTVAGSAVQPSWLTSDSTLARSGTGDIAAAAAQSEVFAQAPDTGIEVTPVKNDASPAYAAVGEALDKIHAATAAKAKGCSFTQHDLETVNQLEPVYHGACQGFQERSSALKGERN
jgi:hypothetical protein